MNTRDKRHPRERYGVVLYKDQNLPHPQSPAALALQVLQYWQRDQTIFRGDRWTDFKTKFLNDFAAEHGKVFCHWCKRDDMILKGGDGVREKDVVTLDHLVPCSKGGGLYDTNNVVPACFACNNARAMSETRLHNRQKRMEKRLKLGLDKLSSNPHNSLLSQP